MIRAHIWGFFLELSSCGLRDTDTVSLGVQGGARNTSEGTDLTESAGVIPRAIHQIFSILDANEAEYTVKCSFLELYNEETTDLLAVGDAMDQKLKMLEDSGRVVVQASILTLAC